MKSAYGGHFLLLFVFYLFCILAHAYRSHQKTDHDRLWLKTRVPRNVGPFGGLDNTK